MAAKIKKGDTVVVLAGKDRGSKGEVLEVRPEENRVVVRGVNEAKRHTKPTQADPRGGVKTFEAPIHVSNVALADPKTGAPTRVGFMDKTEGGKVRKVRVARKSGAIIDG